jgi:hypothetical protein
MTHVNYKFVFEQTKFDFCGRKIILCGRKIIRWGQIFFFKESSQLSVQWTFFGGSKIVLVLNAIWHYKIDDAWRYLKLLDATQRYIYF